MRVMMDVKSRELGIPLSIYALSEEARLTAVRFADRLPIRHLQD
jgi:hypothetical protein